MIYYNEKTGLIRLETRHTLYLMQVDGQGILHHVYYGDPTTAGLTEDRPLHRDPGYLPDLYSLECAGPGLGDFREPSVAPEYPDGTQAADFRFVQACYRAGKYVLPGLPAFRGEAGEAQTLSVLLQDAAGLAVELLYAVFPEKDLITRAAVYRNLADRPVTLRQAGSCCVDFDCGPMEFVTFPGAWAAERTPQRERVGYGNRSVGSTHGISSHAQNPAVILCRPDCTEELGRCWGFALVYSGNFLANVHKSAGGVRFTMGIHPSHFAWHLEPRASFAAPEVAMVYSGQGFGEMSRRFHRAIRENLLPAPWRDMTAPRPVLLNSWEACYFDFDQEKLLNLAGAAKKAEVNLFVLDDGWFGHRNSDHCSLGEWTVNREKLPEGIDGLCRRFNGLGLDLGIWMEPEAVSPDSDLYRAHPDWALEIPGRPTVTLRHQYVLDMGRPEVVDALWAQITALLDCCPIRYLKWDMNRSLTNVYSRALPPERQGEALHRYVLGVYELQGRLAARYPQLLLENCAAGGGRFDCGMLYFSPQIWCSDNTDAASRLMIQYGTSFFYPACCVGSHYSMVPNHGTGRSATVQARMAVALSGTFGFELNLTEHSEEELNVLRRYVRWYRAHGAVIRAGDLYRLLPPDEGCRGGAWMYVTQDKGEAAVFAVGEALRGSGSVRPRLRLRGLDAEGRYEAETGEIWQGDTLMLAGLPIPGCWGDFPGLTLHLKRI